MQADHTTTRWCNAGFRGLVRDDWVQAFQAVDPLDWIERHSVEIVRDRRATRVHRCQTPQGAVYAKIMTGTSNALTPGLVNRLKWALGPSRSLASMRVTRAMQRAGIDCAPIVFAARRRDGLRATEVLVSLEVPGMGAMTILRGELPEQTKLELVRAAARAMASMHAKGFMHGDMHANNMIPLGTPPMMHFIDNDRTRAWHMPLPWLLRERNLSHVGFRMVRTSERLFDALLDEYFRRANVPAARAFRLRRRIDAKVRTYLARRAREKGERGGERSTCAPPAARP